MVIDFHTHAFPDAIAARAVARLEVPSCKAKHDGTVSGLLHSMDAAGVDRAVICSIATKPDQFASILRWSLGVASERLTPLVSIHPADPCALERVRQVKDAGIKGIKLHPYYQDFTLDEERLWPLYEAVASYGLLLVAHTGYDMAFPRIPRATPAMIRNVATRFPELRLVTTHFGAWEDWDDVERLLIGHPIMMELSLSLEALPHDRARRMILAHPPEYLLFGSDSPWGAPGDVLRRLLGLSLDKQLTDMLLRTNAARLLG